MILIKRNDWPYTTPSGHTYPAPTTYADLKARHLDAGQALIEHWDEAECPPEPTWEMVGLAHREVERVEPLLDQAVYLLRRAQTCALDMSTAEWTAARDAVLKGYDRSHESEPTERAHGE